MSKVKNLDLSKKIKELLAMVSAGVITLASTGCGFEGKKNDDVANSPIGYIDEQTLPANETTLSSASTSVETTTTLKPFDKNSGRIKHFDNGTSVVSGYVETSYEDELTTTGTTYTTVKGTNVVSEKNNDDTTKLVVENSKPVTTKSSTTVKITTKPTTKTSVDTTKATTKPTTKTTTVTTKATTAKPTTTVTTTTTEAVTEPVVQGGDRLCINGYYIEDIGNDPNAFICFSKSFWDDILSNVDHTGIYIVDLGYGGTTLGQELNFLLDTLNFNYIGQNVLPYAYYDASEDNINHSKYVAFNFKKNIQDCFGVDIDYSKYIIDDYTGNFLNNADQAYREGWFDSFMDDNINNLPDNPTCLAILYSYDQGRLLNYDEINSKLDDMICNHIPEDILGFTYTK